MPFLLTRTNIRDLQVDARVIGSSACRARSSGADWQPDLWAEQRRIQSLPVGESMVTSGQQFDAKCGIITKPPIWEGGERKETLHLAACYDSALRLAHKRRCRSIAFPLLSGDSNGFPRDLALETAIDTIREFLLKHEITVYLSVMDAWAQMLKKPQIPGLPDETAGLSPQALFELAIAGGQLPSSVRSMDQLPELEMPEEQKPKGFFHTRHPDPRREEGSFAGTLLKRIDEKGLKDLQVCQRSNLDRKVLAKLRSGQSSTAAKQTVLAFCFGLELTQEQTRDLLQKAGCSLGSGSKFDTIIEYYLSKGEYDLYKINRALFAYEQPLLGQMKKL